VEIILGRTFAGVGQVEWRELAHADKEWGVQQTGRILNKTRGEELPAIVLRPKNGNGRSVLWLFDSGKSGLLEKDSLAPAAKRLVDGGVLVCGVDLLYQGEFLADNKPVTQTRRVENPRESAAYTFGYNHSLFSQRVHDILTALRFLSDREKNHLSAVALDAVTGPILAAALAVCGESLHSAALDTHGFRFIQVADLRSPNFGPGGAKYGDLPGMIALNRLRALWLAGEPESASESISRLSSAKVTIPPDEEKEMAAAKWLLAL
jgi:hypothetical protein